MSKEDLLKRLTTLVKLCEDTEPTSKELMYMDKLFSEDLITILRMKLMTLWVYLI
jgi:hypothetical protein